MLKIIEYRYESKRFNEYETLTLLYYYNIITTIIIVVF